MHRLATVSLSLFAIVSLVAPQFIAAVNVTTGEVAWRKRGFGRATVVHADNKLFILDAAGNLAVATATADDFVVHSKAQPLQEFAWTVPTIVGSTMYLRDQERIMALDIG